MKRNFLFHTIRIVVSLLLIFAVFEVGLRLIGFDYPSYPQRSFTVEPEGDFFVYHPSYGFAMQQGEYHINQDDVLKWTSTQNEDGYRITSDSVDITKLEIWIFGCSFTYGWGVNDDESYPWLLQEAMPEYTIKNYGVGAYGTLHSLMQLKDELKKGTKPELVILAYLPFHDQRNTASRFWMRAITTHKKLLNLQYPYARLDGDTLKQFSQPLEYEGVPGSSWLRISGMTEVMYNRWQDKTCENAQVTKLILKQIRDTCYSNGIHLLIVGLESDGITPYIFNNLNLHAINTVDIGLDLSTPEFTFLPADPHPNQAAHQHYAAQLKKYLDTAVLY